MMPENENNAKQIKRLLPRGFGLILAERTQKQTPYIYDVMNGKKFNAEVLHEAVKLAKETARAQAALERKISSLTQVA
jgi:hypothetical protein